MPERSQKVLTRFCMPRALLVTSGFWSGHHYDLDEIQVDDGFKTVKISRIFLEAPLRSASMAILTVSGSGMVRTSATGEDRA